MATSKHKGWINTSNIYAYLLYRTLLALALLLLSQVLFYLANTRIFHTSGFVEWLGIAWGNIVFGSATICLALLPYYFLNLLPFNFRWNKTYRSLTEVLFYYLPVIFVIVANCCDAAYYQYTYRRLSGEIFRYLGISGQMGSLWPHFLIDYWYATLFGILLLLLLLWVGGKMHLEVRNKYQKHLTNDLVGFVVGLAIVVALACGGYGRIHWHNATLYCQPKNSALVSNSAYNILSTLGCGTLHETEYLSDEEARGYFDPAFRPASSLAALADSIPSTGWSYGGGRHLLNPGTDSAMIIYDNVVVIVLESFAQEYMGCYNHEIMPSLTPFLDSLSQHSIIYQGRANGKKSIEGIPAIFASIPTLMSCPLTLSDYANNSLHALPAILREKGYTTAFFHGSYNGVMSFDRLCQRMGFDEYLGQNEYMSNPHSQKADYDGCWGIFDEPFLQYTAQRLDGYKEPFFAGVFTISSHHPYTMQPGYEGVFPKGMHPMCPVVSYSDNALRKFFDAAKRSDWYKHTVFIITADHSGHGLHREYNDYNGWYRIPMMVYIPSQDKQVVSNRLFQQTDIMPTLLDYLGIQSSAACFGTSAFRNPDNGWQLSYGNGYYQLETPKGITLLTGAKDSITDDSKMLQAIVQQYNYRLIHNQLTQ